MENISCDLSAWLLPETLHKRICHEITKSSVKWIETRGGAPDRWELEVIAMRGLHQQGWHRLFKSHCLFACMNCKQDGCSKGISCRLINSCCATGATVASDTTASVSAKTPNFRLAFPSAFVVVAAQLNNDMSSMSSSMSEQYPLMLTVPAEPMCLSFLAPEWPGESVWMTSYPI